MPMEPHAQKEALSLLYEEGYRGLQRVEALIGKGELPPCSVRKGFLAIQHVGWIWLKNGSG